MSFMPNPGSVVRLKDGRIAVVTKVTSLGDDDRVWFCGGGEEKVTAWDIHEVIRDRLVRWASEAALAFIDARPGDADADAIIRDLASELARLRGTVSALTEALEIIASRNAKTETTSAPIPAVIDGKPATIVYARTLSSPAIARAALARVRAEPQDEGQEGGHKVAVVEEGRGV